MPYQNPDNKLAIGFGYTFDVKPGDRITNEQAAHYLEMDLERYVGRVNDLLKGAKVPQIEFDRLVLAAFLGGEYEVHFVPPQV